MQIDGLEVYYGLKIDVEKSREILDVIDYIRAKEQEGYEVYILSATVSEYMIPMRRNNNKFDLLLQGNLGYKGEERVLEKIKKIENPMFLKTEELIFQESVIVDEFIKENYTVVDNVGEFKVYTKEGALK